MNPLAIIYIEIRLAFINLAQAMTAQSQAVATQAQAMTAQAIWEVGPRVNQNTRFMASRLRDFKRMNPQMFIVSMVN